MSQWTHISGIIRVEGLTPSGYAFGYGFKPNKQGREEFAKNWLKQENPHKLTVTEQENIFMNTTGAWVSLSIDNRQAAEKILDSVSRPTGSEGPLELTFAPALKCQQIWGHDGHQSGSFRINLKTLDNDIFDHRVFDAQSIEEDKQLLTSGWYEFINDSFAIAVFGDLRDMDEKRFIKEFEKTVKQLRKYLNLAYIDVMVQDGWEDHITRIIQPRWEDKLVITEYTDESKN